MYSGHAHISRQEIVHANTAENLQWLREFFPPRIAYANATETRQSPRALFRLDTAHMFTANEILQWPRAFFSQKYRL